MHPTLEYDSNRKRVVTCPCGESNSNGHFAPFVGHDKYGYCHGNKAHPPKLFAPNSDHTQFTTSAKYTGGNVQPQLPPSVFPLDVARQSMTSKGGNNLFFWLSGIFGESKARDLFFNYRVGTYNYSRSKWSNSDERYLGGAIYWYFDIDGICRTGNVIVYKPNGHRDKSMHPNWTHTMLIPKSVNFNKFICFFGEHLLNEKGNEHKPVMIVESAKTAVIASAYFPDAVWLASSGLGGLTSKKIEALKGRKVVLYPDLGKYDRWVLDSRKFIGVSESVEVSEFLERNAPAAHLDMDYDVADYLTNNELMESDKRAIADFQKLDNAPILPRTFSDSDYVNIADKEAALAEIEEIEMQLSSTTLPQGTIKLDCCSYTNDIEKTLAKALYNAKLTAGSPHTGGRCLERLRTLRKAVVE